MWYPGKKTLRAIEALGQDLDLTLSDLTDTVRRLSIRIDHQQQQLDIALAAVARVIAKLDPIFGLPEDDPGRVAASKALEEKIIAKLQAEAAVLSRPDVSPNR